MLFVNFFGFFLYFCLFFFCFVFVHTFAAILLSGRNKRMNRSPNTYAFLRFNNICIVHKSSDAMAGERGKLSAFGSLRWHGRRRPLRLLLLLLLPLLVLQAVGRLAMRPPRPGSFLQLQPHQVFRLLVLLVLVALLLRHAVARRVHLVQVLQRFGQEVLLAREKHKRSNIIRLNPLLVSILSTCPIWEGRAKRVSRTRWEFCLKSRVFSHCFFFFFF